MTEVAEDDKIGLKIISMLLEAGYMVRRRPVNEHGVSGHKLESFKPGSDSTKVYIGKVEYSCINTNVGRKVVIDWAGGWSLTPAHWMIHYSDRNPITGGYSSSHDSYSSPYPGMPTIDAWLGKVLARPGEAMKPTAERFNFEPRGFGGPEMWLDGMTARSQAVLQSARVIGFLHLDKRGRTHDSAEDPNANPWLRIEGIGLNTQSIWMLYREGQWLPLNRNGRSVASNAAREYEMTEFDLRLIDMAVQAYLASLTKVS